MEFVPIIELVIAVVLVVFLGLMTLQDLLTRFPCHPAPFLSEDEYEEVELDSSDTTIIPLAKPAPSSRRSLVP